MRVLVADDDRETAATLVELLGLLLAPADILVAYDGQEALAIATQREAPFDAIVMDIEMPRMDGINAAMAVRSALGAASPMLIAVTGNATAAGIARSKAFDHVLMKPIKIAEILTFLRGLEGERDG